MRREQILARVCRALSGKTQGEVAVEIGVDRSLVARFESGESVPAPGQLERLAGSAGLTLADAEQILRHCETLQRPRHRQGEGVADLFDRLAEEVRGVAEEAYRRLLTLPLPGRPPDPEDRRAEVSQEPAPQKPKAQE
jgi:transcriptional regulator with XRE-family HTH domain